MIGGGGSVFDSEWPSWDEEKLKSDRVNVVVQVNGKIRGEISVKVDSDDEKVKQLALAHHNVKKHTEGKKIVKTVVVKNRLISIVVR